MQYMNHVQYPYYNAHTTNNMQAWNFQNDQQVRVDVKQGSMEKQGHVHPHYGLTTIQDNHAHMHPGVTGVAIETEKGHVHKIWGNTSFEDGHIHYYEAYTSPPIALPNGYHTHYAEVKTTKDDGHIHIIKGYVTATKG